MTATASETTYHDDDEVVRGLLPRMRKIATDASYYGGAVREALLGLKQRLDREQTAAELRHREVVETSHCGLEEARNAVTALSTILQDRLTAASAHLTMNGVSIPQHNAPDLPPIEAADVATAMRLVSESQALVRSVDAAVSEGILPRKRVDLFADGSFAPVGIGAFVFGVVAGISTHNFGIFMAATIGSFIAVVAVVHRMHQGPLQDAYSSAARDAASAAFSLQRYFEIMSKHHEAEVAAADERRTAELVTIMDQYRADISKLDQRAIPTAEQLQARIAAYASDAGFAVLDWSAPGWSLWKPALRTAFAARLGTLTLDTADLTFDLPSVPPRFHVPALAPFPSSSIVFKAAGSNKDRCARAVQGLLARLVATIPPGKLRFTLIDPVALGNNVAGIMELGDYEESLITSRAWTEPSHIEQRLLDITEHMETVIQKYLRQDFETIEQYNVKAKEIAEPYRFVVIFDFPTNFTEASARRLLSIVRNGARCGVQAIVVCDTAKELPYGFNMAELERSAVVMTATDESGDIRWIDPELSLWQLELENPPPNEIMARLVKETGEPATAAMRVEVPYDTLLDLANVGPDSWETANTANALLVPLGRNGAREVQFLTLGQGLSHHVLVVGRPGSGKSNLMHVMITSVAVMYQPDEIELYLIDFKKGVEFKPYAEHRIPHARAIAIESDREFAFSVLERLDVELKHRGDLFRDVGVSGISEYRAKSGAKLPRVLLIVDEFQEFFTIDDQISRSATLYLDRLVRQGRAFGIHVVLGSQTLAGSYNLTRGTLDQMAVRIAMQCSEADSRLILANDNGAARLLSRPGEAIYNASSGLLDGNVLFQIARLSDEAREAALAKVEASARQIDGPVFEPVIFEGNEPAPLEACRGLQALLAAPWTSRSATDLYLGEPVAIRESTTARLRRQTGSNLLLLSRDEDEGCSMCFAALVSIVAQRAPQDVRIVIGDFSLDPEDSSDRLGDIAALFPHGAEIVRLQRKLAESIRSIAGELTRRLDAPPERTIIVLMLLGLQRMRALRADGLAEPNDADGRPTSDLFSALLRDGPELGIHVVAWCDSLANAVRTVGRSAMSEFGLRAASVMSLDDSMQFLDDSAAGRLDKPYRSVFADEARPGQLQKYRPFAVPTRAWLEKVAAELRSRVSKAE